MNKVCAPSRSSQPLAALALLWFLGWTLRIPVLSIPPLSARIADDHGLSEVGVGALTMLPVVAIAFGAIAAAWFIRRVGFKAAIVGGVFVMAIASAARSVAPSASVLLTLSVVMGCGVAVVQTALPNATRAWTPAQVGVGSAVYLNGMMVGEIFGAGLTLPVMLPMAGGSWRVALILWSVPVIFVGLAVLSKRRETTALDSPTDAVNQVDQPVLPRWNDADVWRYGLLLAGSVVAFYVVNAFAATLLRARGESAALAGLLLAFNSMPIVASVTVIVRPRWIGVRGPLASATVASAIALAFFVFLSGWISWAAAVVVGYASTLQLILLMSLPATLATGSATTRLNAGMTLVGYGFAFALPLLGGWVAASTGRIEMALVPALVFASAAILILGKHQQFPRYT